MKITKFKVTLKQNDKYIIVNPANSGTIRVDSSLYDKIISGDVSKFSDKEKAFLINSSFLVDDNYDDDILQQTENKYLSSALNIVFMTTEDCNFKCSYCYETHNKNKIGKTVYENAIKLVEKSDKDNLTINWFGGEPLLAINSIEYFMNEVYNLNKFKKIESSIITNGYLLSLNNFKRLISAHVNVFQITLDGLKEEHDSKRFLKNGNGTFDKIINNIINMKNASEEFTVYLRYNYNEQSKILDYVDFIKSIIGTDKRFILDFHAIGDWNSTFKGVPTAHWNETSIDAMKKAYRQGMRIRCAEEDICPSGHFCVAKMNDGYIINYKGDIMKCTIMLDWEKNLVGHLNNDGIIEFNDNYNFWKTPVTCDKCNMCNVRPVCLNKFCPHADTAICSKQEEKLIIDALRVKYE